ncbi:MAG TPA: T9SS type A sorting domain-containing protein, partial [Saprospiraceae bacterium]|nr:T9SS type A sorting domain-containing protein [Saprospiraceae bacterium]
FINVDLEHDRKVTAIVKNKSGIEAVWLYYSEDKEQSTWERIQMERGNNDYYTATLPKFDSIMFYYVEGIALSGKSISRPMTAPDGYFTTRAMVSSSSHNLDNATKVQIYPNPANAITCVDIQSTPTQKTKVYINDDSGKIVMTLYDGLGLPVSQKLFFNAKSLTPGTYYLNIQKDNKCMIEKFVVIH